MLTPSERVFTAYLRIIAVGTAIVLGAVVLLNYFVNPYSIYNAPSWTDINAHKPQLFKHLRLTKATAVTKRRPDALLIGSSRTEHGLDPEHPAFQERYNSYNLALNGATIYENLRYFQHANANREIKKVVLAVDFFQFNAYRPNSPDFDEARLASDLHGQKQKVRPTTDLLATLASVDALMASLKTLIFQSQRKNVILPRGQVQQPDSDAIMMMRGGRREAARYSELNYISHLYFPRPHNRFDFIAEEKYFNTFDYFRRMLEDSHRDAIELIILISPSHARQWELIAATGLWDKWEIWKREIVRINEEVARWYRRPPYPLWDFSGYNTYTTEPVPSLGDKQTMMQWYWESSHYRKELGDLVLDRVFNMEDPERPIADDFGVRLTGRNIEAHLDRIRADRQRYRLSHRSEVAEIEELVRKYRPR